MQTRVQNIKATFIALVKKSNYFDFSKTIPIFIYINILEDETAADMFKMRKEMGWQILIWDSKVIYSKWPTSLASI